MIENGDTIPYQLKIEVHNSDTSYFGSCNTFEKVNNRIINRQVECTRVGYWEVQNDNGTTTSKGEYTSWGRETGNWKTFDKKGQLIRETEYASIAKDTYILRKVKYVEGRAIIVSEKTWFAQLYLKHVLLIAIVILGSFFIRVPVNMAIAKRQFKQKPTFYLPGKTSFDKSTQYMIGTMFMFWWSDLNTENKTLGYLSNTLSVIALGGFLGVIIGLGISGELK
jgi:hypothetical protein